MCFPRVKYVVYYCVYVKSLQLCLILCDCLYCSPPGSSVHRDSPGKNTGVGCHALLQGMFPQGSNPSHMSPALADGLFTTSVTCLQFSSAAQCDPIYCSPPGSSVHRDSPGKNTGVCHQALLQRSFPTQGSNPGLPHCRQILCLSHQGN